MAQTQTALFEILDHETGDTWRGTHGHTISVEFNRIAGVIAVHSRNDISAADIQSAFFTLGQLKEQIAGATTAKYFGDFNAQLPPDFKITL